MSNTDVSDEGNLQNKFPRRLLINALLLILPLLFYWQTAWSMIEIWWRSDTFAHGFIILPISLYLIWEKRKQLSQQPINTNAAGLILLLLCGLFWFLANLVDIAVIQQMMFTAMIPAAVLTLFGWTITRTILFPLCFLFFMVPFGERLIPSLIDFTAFFTIRSIQLTGIPIYWEGNNLSLPSGNWSVVEACSGIRYLIASIALGSLYCYISFQSQLKRTLFFSLFIIVPIMANGLRAFMIVMIGHFSSMKLATGVDHIIYGWVFFGFVMFIMFYIGSFWADDVATEEETLEATGESDAVESTAPKPPLSPGYRASIPVVLGAVALILIWPLMVYQKDTGSNTVAVSTLPPLPAELGAWQLEQQSIADWRPIYSGAAVELKAVYRNGEQRIGVFLEHYPRQSQDAELINSQNLLVEERSAWAQVEDVRVEVFDVGGLEQVKQARLKSNGTNLVVWSWYHLAGKNTVNDYVGKLYGLYGSLLKGDESATGVILYIEYTDTVEQQQKTLSAFSALLLPWFNNH